MHKLGFNSSQGSPPSSHGFPAGSTSDSNTAEHVQVEYVQSGPSNKRKAPQIDESDPRVSKKSKISNEVRPSTTISNPGESIGPVVSQDITTPRAAPLFEKVGRPRLCDNRFECSSSDAAGPLSASQQCRIRARIAASSTKQKIRETEVVLWRAPEKVEVIEEPIISTAELEVEAVKRVFGEQLAAFANNADEQVPDRPFRTWKNGEEKFKLMTRSSRGGGIDGLIKSRNGKVIRPPKPPVPLFQEPDTNKGRGKAISSAQIRKVMQCKAGAPSENKLYKPRYPVSKNLCPGQDSRTLPMNLLNRLDDSEPESVSPSEVAMMKELIRPNVEKIKKRRERRAARNLAANKVKALVFSTKANTGEVGSGPSVPATTEQTHARSAARSRDSIAGSSERTGFKRASEMTLEEMQRLMYYRRTRTQTPTVQTSSKRKRDDDADVDLAAPKGKRPQRHDSSP